MTKSLKKEQRNEAIKRIKQLIKRFKLNPNILKYFKEGKIYYSYEVFPGFITSIDNITYDPRYVELVKNIEKKYGILVYHCILTANQFTMLYISKYKEDWPVGEITDDNYILAAVHDIDANFFEFGSVLLSSLNGVLIRIG